MTAYIVRRLLATIPVMVVVALFVFFLLHLTPGDPAAVIAGDDASPAEIDGVRRKLGLDRPVWEQFGIYIWSLMRGDLGTSIFSNLPVTTLVKQRLEPSVVLALSTLVVARSRSPWA
jgi:peptide/nickel transport system permease protein